MRSKTIVTITVAVIAIAAVYVLFNDIQIQKGNEKASETKSTTPSTTVSLQNESTQNIPYSVFRSKYVTTYLLQNETGPNGVLADKNGLVWTSGSSLHSLLKLDSKNNKLEYYQILEEKLGHTMVWSMVEDKNGYIWFSQLGTKPLWRFDTDNKRFTLFHTSSPPFQMKIQNETGDIWFTTLTGNTIGVIQKIENKTVPSYKITEFPTGKDTMPSGLFLKDGSIWVAELGTGKIVKFDVLRNNGNVDKIVNVLKIPPNDNVRFSFPTDVLVQNNETIWVTEHGPSTIAKYDLKSNSWKRFPTAQTTPPIPTLPFWMRESLDHKGIWFNEHEGNRIGFLNTTDHTLLEFEIPNNQAPELSPYMINNPIALRNISEQNAYFAAIFTLNLSVDPTDPNKLFFSQWNNNKIGVVDRSPPLSFDINSNLTKITFSSNDTMQKAIIKVEISTKNIVSNHDSEKMIFLRTSSSMMSDGGFEKIIANFTPDSVYLSNTSKTIPVQLVLQNEGAKPGNYTVGISATDGLVTKTIFQQLVVR